VCCEPTLTVTGNCLLSGSGNFLSASRETHGWKPTPTASALASLLVLAHRTDRTKTKLAVRLVAVVFACLPLCVTLVTCGWALDIATAPCSPEAVRLAGWRLANFKFLKRSAPLALAELIQPYDLGGLNLDYSSHESSIGMELCTYKLYISLNIYSNAK